MKVVHKFHQEDVLQESTTKGIVEQNVAEPKNQNLKVVDDLLEQKFLEGFFS